MWRMTVPPDEISKLRDQALASEAFGNVAAAMDYWRAAIAATERWAAQGHPTPDLEWLRGRLTHAGKLPRPGGSRPPD
nr:hypothetical protein [uncultured Lichenicoccus sp.]